MACQTCLASIVMISYRMHAYVRGAGSSAAGVGVWVLTASSSMQPATPKNAV